MQGLLKMGIRGVTVSDVRGFGAQGGSTERQAGKLSLYRIVGTLMFSVFLLTPDHGLCLNILVELMFFLCVWDAVES